MSKKAKPGPKPRLLDPLNYGKPFLTAEEAGECLGLSRAEIYKFLRGNALPIPKNGRRYLIPAQLVKSLQDGSYFLLARGIAVPGKSESQQGGREYGC